MTETSLVCDIGSGTLKLGLSGYLEPQLVCENMIGRPRFLDLITVNGKKDYFIGTEAQSKRALLSLSYPVEKGIVKDWNALEVRFFLFLKKKEILNFAFLNELRQSPEEHPVLLTELPITNDSSRRKYCQLFFESFNATALTTKSSSILNLFASGRTSGIVLDCGEGLSWAVPMFEGYTFPHAILSSDCAGGEVTDVLMNKLRNGRTGSGFYSSSDRELVKIVKENMCYVSNETFENKKKRKEGKSSASKNKKDFTVKLKGLEPEFKRLDNEKKMLDDEEMGPVIAQYKVLKEKKEDYENELKKAESTLKKLEIEKKKSRGELQKQYILPDGSKITMSKERIKAPEILFDTSLIGMEFPGLHELVYNSIQLCNIDVKQALYQNIVLAGGTTLLTGLESRLKDELQNLAPQSVKLNLVAPENRIYSSWVGGSVYSLMPNYLDNYLTKDEYEENGLHHKKTWEKFLFN